MLRKVKINFRIDQICKRGQFNIVSAFFSPFPESTGNLVNIYTVLDIKLNRLNEKQRIPTFVLLFILTYAQQKNDTNYKYELQIIKLNIEHCTLYIEH